MVKSPLKTRVSRVFTQPRPIAGVRYGSVYELVAAGASTTSPQALYSRMFCGAKSHGFGHGER